MNPITGILLIALEVLACQLYVPFKKVKIWAWEFIGYQGVAAWLIAPILFAYIFISERRT